MIKLAIPRNKA